MYSLRSTAVSSRCILSFSCRQRYRPCAHRYRYKIVSTHLPSVLRTLTLTVLHTLTLTGRKQVYFLRSMAVLIQAGPGGGVDVPAVKAVLHAQGLERCLLIRFGVSLRVGIFFPKSPTYNSIYSEEAIGLEVDVLSFSADGCLLPTIEDPPPLFPDGVPRCLFS